MEGRIYTTLKNAFNKTTGHGIETIQELDEECTHSNLQTGSQTDLMVSNKRGSIPTKELSRSKSKEGLVQTNKENFNSNSNPKSASKISEFNEGSKLQVTLTSPPPKKCVHSPKPTLKENNSSIKNSSFGNVNRTVINENMKFSFKKSEEENPPSNSQNVFISNKAPDGFYHQPTQANLENAKATKSVNRSNTNEHVSLKDSVCKSSSVIQKQSRELAQKRQFGSEKIFLEKSLKLRQKEQGFFNRKVTFAIPNFTNLLKQSKEVSQTMIQTNYPAGPRCDDRNGHFLFLKSRDKMSRDVSAHSKSSKESYETDFGQAPMIKNRKNKSHLDLRAQPLQNMPRSSTLKFHKV